ncbi:isochorismatase family protein [Chloroflexota bacterium]
MHKDTETTSKQAWYIDPTKTALIVTDMQRACLDEDAPLTFVAAKKMVPLINDLASMCRRLRIPVVWLRQVNRSDLSDVGLLQAMRPRQLDSDMELLEGRKGADLSPQLIVMPDDYVIAKIRYSAFICGSSNLEPLLRGLGRDSLITCGVATDVCVGTTVADAMMLGFKVFVVGDLTATLTEERQRIALEVLDKCFAKVVTFNEVQVELRKLLGVLSSQSDSAT